MRSARARKATFSARFARVPLALASVLLGLGSCVCPPSLDEWSEVGFRTPEETLRSFQLAVRADAPRVEYRCLSAKLRRGVPQIAWREAREEWYAENPFLRSGIAKAEIVSREALGDARYRFVVESYGRSFVIELVREDFAQVYSEGELVVDELLPYDRSDPYRDAFEDFASVSAPENGARFVSGGITVPADALPETPGMPPSISELRIGFEWKVDALGPVEEADSSPDSKAPTP